ncbi:hypothetical protein P8452_35895 [Trifolium repens]|nr:translocase inner membrane subunit 44-1 [Trifolium repens]WJX49461.1 hypothetical protein P8452_35895 [Trifolium repens]
MATKKLIRDLFLAQRSLILPHQGLKTRLSLNSADRRGYSASIEFSKKVKDETVSFSSTFSSTFKSTFSSPRVSTSFQKLKDVKIVDITKKGYAILKEELSSNSPKRQRVRFTPTGEISTKTDLVVMPSNQSWLSKKFDEIMVAKVTKHFNKYTAPVKTKIQEMIEDLEEIYDTSDNPIIRKIQDITDTMFQETKSACTYKEIRQRDPSFSLPDFVGEVQEAIKPVLNAYIKGDVETLKKYCCSQLIERCKAEHNAYKSNGIFFDKKILHISDLEVREAKMVEASPVIIVAFPTQQIYCVRDRNGAITEGGKDTIHTVFYQWALQQMDREDQGDDDIYLMWKLREMQQQGIQALI